MNYNLSNIGIVILNYNGEELLKRFLPDIIKYSQKSNIYVIDNGRVIEQGTHTQLLKNNGSYKRLYELQFAEQRENLSN